LPVSIRRLTLSVRASISWTQRSPLVASSAGSSRSVYPHVAAIGLARVGGPAWASACGSERVGTANHMASAVPIGSVRVGRYRLELGDAAGMLIARSPDLREGDAARLARALAQQPQTAGEAASEIVDSGLEVTRRTEQAVALAKDLAAGRIDPRAISGHVDLMLDMLARLDGQGRWEEELRLARQLNSCGGREGEWRGGWTGPLCDPNGRERPSEVQNLTDPRHMLRLTLGRNPRCCRRSYVAYCRLKRTTGLEPATFGLGSRRSTD
jgi:hypothetical protein